MLRETDRQQTEDGIHCGRGERARQERQDS